MSKKVIPAQTIFICDGCKKEQDASYGGIAFPVGWYDLKFANYDGGSSRYLDGHFCPDCSEQIESFIESLAPAPSK